MHSDTIIIGAGPAGLALSYYLSQRHWPHRILEAGRIAEHWRTRRWDSLRLVAPNWHLQLPAMPYNGPDRDGFMHRDEVVAYLEAYAAQIKAPVECNTAVNAVRAGSNGDMQIVCSGAVIAAQQVVVATGAYTTPHIPAAAVGLDPAITQLHSMHYRRPDQLPPGAVLVVGSGESGCQIAEELRRAGRDVWLAVGRCSWLPRRYRGRDATAWITEFGGFEQTVDTLPDGDPRNAPAGPQLTGRDGGRDLNLHTLAAAGVQLLGRLEALDGAQAHFALDLGERIAAADIAAAEFLQAVDAYVVEHQIAAPPPDRPNAAQAYAAAERAPGCINLHQAGITTLLWATGYRPAYPWIELPVFAADGYPQHRRGVTAVPGLYFLGLEWQYKAKSHVLQGIGEDAAYIAEQIVGKP